MRLRWLDAFPESQVLLQRQIDWLAALPPLSQNREAAFEVARRLFAAPPALGEDRPQLGALRYELQFTDGNFRRDRVQPAAFPIGREEKSFGIVDILWERNGFGVYRLNIRPKGSIPLHVHRIMNEWELVISPGLLLQGNPATLLHASAWPHGLAHRYDNPHEQWQTVLCVDEPAFVPSDEIPVPLSS